MAGSVWHGAQGLHPSLSDSGEHYTKPLLAACLSAYLALCLLITCTKSHCQSRAAKVEDATISMHSVELCVILFKTNKLLNLVSNGNLKPKQTAGIVTNIFDMHPIS